MNDFSIGLAFGLAVVAAIVMGVIIATNQPYNAAERYVMSNEERTAQFVIGVARSEQVLNGVSGPPDESNVRCLTTASGTGWNWGGKHDTTLVVCELTFRFDAASSTLEADYYVKTDYPNSSWRNFLPKRVKYVVQDEFLDIASMKASPGLRRAQPGLANGETDTRNIARPPAIPSSPH